MVQVVAGFKIRGAQLPPPPPGGGDTTPPEVFIVQPLQGAVIIGSSVALSGFASDTGSGVDYVETAIDTNPFQRATGGSNWAISYTGVPQGLHVVQVRARDLAGNFSAIRIVAFTIQTAVLPPPPPTFPPPPPNFPPPPLPPPPAAQPSLINIAQFGSTYQATDNTGTLVSSGTVANNVLLAARARLSGIGGDIKFGSGRFPLNDQLIGSPADSSINIRGSGPSTIIERVGTRVTFMIHAPVGDVILGDFNIDGLNTQGGEGGFAIRVRDSVNNIKVQNVHTQNFLAAHYINDHTDSPPTNVTWSNMSSSGAGVAMVITAGQNIKVENPKFELLAPISGSTGLQVSTINAPAPLKDIIITNPTITGYDRGLKVVNYNNAPVAGNLQVNGGTIKGAAIAGAEFAAAFNGTLGVIPGTKLNNVTIRDSAVGIMKRVHGILHPGTIFINNVNNIDDNNGEFAT